MTNFTTIAQATKALHDKAKQAEDAQKSTLSNQKHQQQDFFVADIFAAASLRSDIDSMALPLFALRGGDTKDIIYDLGDTKISITPTSAGRATIHDKDLWIYAISKLMTAINEGKQPSRTVRFTVYDYLVTTNRTTGGRDYVEAHETLKRLKGTTISIESGSAELRNRKAMGFGLLESFKVVEEKDGRMLRVEMTLPDWLYRSIHPKGVLKISPDYFRIRKPINRRIYEIARKFCGNQTNFQIGLDNLYKRIGSKGAVARFRYNIKELVGINDLPDYSIEFDDKKDMVTFINRSKIEAPSDDEKENKAEWLYFAEYKIPYEYRETAKDRFGLEYNGNTKLWVYDGTDEPPQELEQYIVRKEMRKC
jgi:plasmid replication initiation protein